MSIKLEKTIIYLSASTFSGVPFFRVFFDIWSLQLLHQLCLYNVILLVTVFYLHEKKQDGVKHIEIR